MAVVKIDSNNAQNFVQRRLLPKGIYLFEVGPGRDQVTICVVPSKKDGQGTVPVALHILEPEEFKGATAYDTISLKPKAEFKLVHLALACGQSKDTIKSQGVDLDALLGAHGKAEIDVQPERTDPITGQKFNPSNRVARYIFD